MGLGTFSKILIIIGVGSILAWIFCLIKLSDVFNVIILSFTAWVVSMQSFATEKMAKYQVVPAIDVKMIYAQTSNPKNTYFWFSNESNLPGWIYLKYEKNGNGTIERVYERLRIAAKSKMKTSDSFFENLKENDEIKLYVTIEPAFEEDVDEKLDKKINFKKSYKFYRNQWNETSWSLPDNPFPFPAETKKCSDCKSDIDSKAKKCKYCLSIN